MLAYVRKFLTAVLGNGAVIAELELMHDGRTIVAILTLVGTMLGVYAVPNARALPRTPTKTL